MKKQQLSILKIGGNIVNDDPTCHQILSDFKKIKTPKILVHGGAKKASELMRKMGLQPNIIDGRRVTDAATLEVVTMVYAGLMNKKIVSRLQAMDCNAIGLTGADANAIQAHRRVVQDVDYGFVGDIDEVGTAHIHQLLEADFTPIFCAITHDKKGQLLNTNADSIAAHLAVGMSELYEVKLIYCFEKDGVLLDVNDEDSVIETLDKKTFKKYKISGRIHTGMLPKLTGAFFAAENGVQEVVVAGTNVLSNPNKKGTTICV